MPTHPTKATSPVTNDPYLELCRRHPLRPIRDEAGLRQATAMIHALLDQESLTPDEDDYLDVLATLVEKFESEHFPTPRVSDSEMLRFLMDSREINLSQTARASGIAESAISEVLSGKRTLTRTQIEELSAVFHVNPAAFLNPITDIAAVGDQERS